MAVSSVSSVGTDFASVARNYSLSNQSQVSSVYKKEATKGVSQTGKVGSASPVMYPNADVKAADSVAKAEDEIKAENSFNSVAAKFQGAMTAYNMDATASAYGMSGSTINLFA